MYGETFVSNINYTLVGVEPYNVNWLTNLVTISFYNDATVV